MLSGADSLLCATTSPTLSKQAVHETFEIDATYDKVSATVRQQGWLVCG